MSDLSYDDLVESIYGCSLNPGGWDYTLSQIRDHLQASAINLIGLDVATHNNPFVYTANIPADRGKHYQQYWFERDPWVKAAARKGLGYGGATLVGSQLVDRQELVKTEFYNDWLKDQDIKDVLSTNLWGQEPNWGKDLDHPRLVLCFMRGHSGQAFEETDRLKLERLSRHLNRAFNIAMQMGMLARGSQLSQATIDALRQAVIVLDEQGQIVATNPEAQQQLSLGKQVFGVRHGRLITLGEEASPTLEQAFALAKKCIASPISFRSLTADGIPCVRSARLAPLSETIIWGLPESSARFLLIVHPGPCVDDAAFHNFATLFRLTRSEQAVLRRLMLDASAEDVAAHLHVSLPTVRTHIQNLRNKTGVRRISDLISMALAATRIG